MEEETERNMYLNINKFVNNSFNFLINYVLLNSSFVLGEVRGGERQLLYHVTDYTIQSVPSVKTTSF